MTAQLTDRRALITAGAAGIGLAIAEVFHGEGARIVICDVDEAALERTRQAHLDWGVLNCDVSRRDEVDALFAAAAERYAGALDILVNNAGIAGPTGGIETVDPEEWERTLAVNLTGAFLVTRRAVPMLRAAGGGAIIGTSRGHRPGRALPGRPGRTLRERRALERGWQHGVAELSAPGPSSSPAPAIRFGALARTSRRWPRASPPSRRAGADWPSSS